MRLPSVPKLMSIGIDKPTAVAVRAFLAWIVCRQYDRHPKSEDWATLNRMLGGFGDEYTPQGHNRKSPAIHYINMGDTYATTLLYVRSRWVVGCWGDIVERGDYA